MSPVLEAIARPQVGNGTEAVLAGYNAAQANQLNSLRAATAQQELQQNAQMFPSKLQQQQAAAQEQQMRVQQAQQAQRDANILSTAQRTVLANIAQQNSGANASAAPAGATPVPDVPSKSSDGTGTGTAETDAAESEDNADVPGSRRLLLSGGRAVTLSPQQQAQLSQTRQQQWEDAGRLASKPMMDAAAGGRLGAGPALDAAGSVTPSSLVHPAVIQAAPGIAPIIDDGDIYGQMLMEARKDPNFSVAGQIDFAKGVLAQKEQLAKFNTEQLKQKSEQYDQLAGRFDSFVKQPDDYKDRNWPSLLDGMTRDGLMSPKEEQSTLQRFPQYPGDDRATYLGVSHLAESQLMKRNLDEQDITQKAQANQSSRASEWAGQMDTFVNYFDDDEKPKMWRQNVQAGVARGALTQPEANDILKRYPIYPGNRIASTIGGQFLNDKQLQERQKGQTDNAKSQLDVDEKRRLQQVSLLGSANSQQDYAKRLSGISQSDVVKFGYPDPSEWNAASTPQAIRQLGMTPEQQSQAVANAQPKTEAELARDAADPTKPASVRAAASEALRRLDQSKLAARPVTNITTVPGLGGAGASELTGEDYLATLPPSAAAQVRAVAEGRAVMPSATSRAQAAQDLRSAVFSFDPDYSDQRAQTRKAFTTGKPGDNIRSMNTAVVHLDQLDEAAKALENGKFTPLNNLYNQVKTWTGSAVPTNFDTVKSAVAGELATALKGSATDIEVGEMRKNLNSANSWDQLHQGIESSMHIVGQKLNTANESYHQQIPGDTVWNPVLPSARAVFQKHGIDPTAPPPKASEQPSAQGGYQVGHIYVGKDGPSKYLGGDPKQRSSWQTGK